MRYPTVYVALAVWAVQSVIAELASPDIPQGAFSVQQVATGRKVRRSVAAELMRTFHKYNVPVPAKVRAAAALQSTTVVATPENSVDSAYTCPVKIGANTLKLNFDTGSSDLWAFSTLLPSSQRAGHISYDVSTGSQVSGETFSLNYGDGSQANGVVYFDKVVVGSISATSMAVEAATSVSSQFANDQNVDGLLGLAFPPLNQCQPKQCKQFLQSVISNFPTKVFTASLKKGKPGFYDFGYIDSNKYNGTIHYNAVDNSSGLWKINTFGYFVGSTHFTYNRTAVYDTGTTLILVTNTMINDYYAGVKSAYYDTNLQAVLFLCSETLPAFGIDFRWSNHSIPGSYLNYAPLGDGYCYGGIQPAGNLPFNIIGDIFLKGVFVVFDPVTPRVGIATPRSY